MKILVFLLITLIALPCPTAQAESPSWVRVTDDNVYLFADNNALKRVCKLEKSYYLEVISEENGMYLVSIMQGGEFPRICGYVNKYDVKQCETPSAPFYPNVKITVSGNSASLKLSPTPNSETVVVATNTQQMCYYGQIESYNRNWYYVSYCGFFGYVEESNVTTPVVALHPTPLTPETTTPVVAPVDVEPTVDTPTTNTSAEMLLVVFVCLLSIGLVLALFLPNKKSN